MIVKYKLALLKNVLVSQLVILSAGMLTLISLLKSVILIYSYCRDCSNCSSTLEDKLVKFQNRAARVILDCDLYTPSSELFKELDWQTFPEIVTYQKAILMYRLINNICPDYLKKLCLIYF